MKRNTTILPFRDFKRVFFEHLSIFLHGAKKHIYANMPYKGKTWMSCETC